MPASIKEKWRQTMGKRRPGSRAELSGREHRQAGLYNNLMMATKTDLRELELRLTIKIGGMLVIAVASSPHS